MCPDRPLTSDAFAGVYRNSSYIISFTLNYLLVSFLWDDKLAGALLAAGHPVVFALHYAYCHSLSGGTLQHHSQFRTEYRRCRPHAIAPIRHPRSSPIALGVRPMAAMGTRPHYRLPACAVVPSPLVLYALYIDHRIQLYTFGPLRAGPIESLGCHP